MLLEIIIYQTSSGHKPFSKWFEALKDTKAKSLILNKLDRVKQGNFGDTKPISNGVRELRLHISPGYRIYYAKEGNKIILLLCGGTKSKQQNDIAKAIRYLSDFKIRGSVNDKNKKN
jgi:putative addiction module killer protein